MKRLLSAGMILGIILMLPPVAARGATIYGIRCGAHGDFDRVVLELSVPIDCQIESVDSLTLRIHLGRVEVSSDFRVAPLPKKTASILSVRASGGGEVPFIVNVRLRESSTTRMTKLGGLPYRMAVDIAPVQTEPPLKEEPSYIPGDRPYPTKFAQSATRVEGVDSAKMHAILAHYFTAIGDSAGALREALAYEALTGKFLYIGPEMQVMAPPMLVPQTPSIFFPWLKVDYLIAFGAGILGFAFAALISLSGGWWTRRHIRDQAENLMARARRIQKTYQQPTQSPATADMDDPPSQTRPTPVESEGEQPLEASEIQKLKQSATDRRVQRVLQLAGEGKTIADIAQELEMSEDEIKLILDLNR